MKNRGKELRIAGLLIGLSIIYFIIAMMLAEALYPGYSISNNYISDLGVGPSALLFNASIIFLGVLLLIGAYFYERGSKQKVFSTLLAIAAVAAICVGVFNENFGAIHEIVSAIVFISGGVAALYFAVREKSVIRYPSLVLGLTGLSATVLSEASVYLGIGPGGMERMIVYPILLWGVLFAGRLLAM